MEENVRKEVKEVDVLDDFRKVEKTVRQRALASSMKLFKEKATAIMRLKEETIALLEALGIQESDMKRVIDFVNSLPDVQLSESDKRVIREEMLAESKKQKKKAVDKIEESPYIGGTIITYPPVDTNMYMYRGDNIKWTGAPSQKISYGTSTGDSVLGKATNGGIETFCSTVN